MKIAREIAGLSITAVLLSQCGCSASSFRNLFAKNHRSDFHTLEELDAKDSSKTAETAAATKSVDAKTTSWNPFKRDGQTAETQADSAATTASAGAGFWKNPFGGDDSPGTDPFLPAEDDNSTKQSDVKTAEAEHDRDADDRAGQIARTSGIRDTDSDSSDMTIAAKPRKSAEENSVLTAAELEIAEPLILRSEDQPVASSMKEFEKQKIMQLEELLASGDVQKTVRNARGTATKAGEQAESTLSRSRAAIAEKSANASAKARSVAQKGSAEFDEFFEELESEGSQTAQQLADAVTDYSETGEAGPDEALIPNSGKKSRKGSFDSTVADHSDSQDSDVLKSDDVMDLIADSNSLPKPGKSASQHGRKVEFADNDETVQSDFQWQSSRKPAEKKSDARAANGVRQVSMMDDAGVDSAKPETDNWLQDEIFAPKPAPKLPARTVSANAVAPKNSGRRREQPAADPFVSGEMDGLSVEEQESAPAPAAVRDPEASTEDTVSEAVLPGDVRLDDQGATIAPSGRKGLSTRSLVAIVAGLTIVGFLFLPARRKMAAQKPAVLQS
ncbi:MAG: hypothetical protein WCK86_11065 [Planctomycetia bacterium]